tara:strand:+ start:3803 stop:4762 length:960 start_codon:yes stop_codon:yes gene_type:complete
MDINSDKHLHCTIDELVKMIIKLFRRFNPNVPKQKLLGFVNTIIYSKYFLNNENAYHNLQHTFEVFQMTSYLIQNYKNNHFKREECTILQVAALCHDYGHNGIPNSQWHDTDIHKQVRKVSSCESELSWIMERVNSSTLIEKSSFSCESSTSQEIHSYNEIMHIDKTIAIILKYRKWLFPNITEMQVTTIITKLILATDLSEYKSYIELFKCYTHTKMYDMMLILKLADISHVLRPFQVHSYWVYKLQNETTTTKKAPTLEYISSDTLFFVHKFVIPLLEIFIERNPKAKHLSTNVKKNINIWLLHSPNSSLHKRPLVL